jgi:hypothetical protein
MRTAYQLNSKYLPTLEFMLKYYREKVKTTPELQSQVQKFEREVASVKAQADKSKDTGTATTGPESSASNVPILPQENQLKNTLPEPSTN